MDIDHEINKHLEWIETIASLLGDEDITQEEVEEISRHDRCALGQWLDSEDSTRFKDMPELEELKESHEAFHNLAGQLITAFEAGKEAEAIESQEKLVEMSKKVVGYLYLLQLNSGETGDD